MNIKQVQFYVISLLLPEPWLAAKTSISALSTAIPLTTIPAAEHARARSIDSRCRVRSVDSRV